MYGEFGALSDGAPVVCTESFPAASGESTAIKTASADDQGIISPALLSEAEQVEELQRKDTGDSRVDDKRASVRILPADARQEVHVITHPQAPQHGGKFQPK
ncbi:MAG: hypothetical protein ND895_15075 [Pyrinomonadaceae bacterium]|nr:hypothetical protein [Pyrinomonadaceae bacterium]